MNMKKYIIFSFLLVAVLFSGCKKDDGMTPKDVLIDAVPQPTVVINGGSAAIDLTNLASFQGKFDVGLLYPNDIKPEKLDVVVRKNGNNNNIKLFQAGVTTFPSTFTITAAQFVALFGTPIALGDNYDIGVDIFANGKKYEAFPVIGAAYGSTGVANQPGFSVTVRYSAICAYDPNIYQGNFVVVSDAWADFVPGDVVAFTRINATSFSWINPFVRNPIPVIVTVNPANNTVSIAKQLIGTSWVYSANPATYPDPTMSASGANNLVAPCDKTLTLNIQYGINGVAGGIFGGGPYLLEFRKQ
jgi:hypothetical protein